MEFGCWHCLFHSHRSRVPVGQNTATMFIYLDVHRSTGHFGLGTKKVRFVCSVGVTIMSCSKLLLPSVSPEYDDADTKRETCDREYDFQVARDVTCSQCRFWITAPNSKLGLRAGPHVPLWQSNALTHRLQPTLWNAGMNIACCALK